MKTRELFSPIPKEIFRSDDVRERVEIFLVLLVVASLGYKFVTGCIDNFLSLDDHNLALVIFVNAGIAVAFLLAYLLVCWVFRLALSFIYDSFFHKNNPLPVENTEEPNVGAVNVQVNLSHQELNVTQVNFANTTVLQAASAVETPNPESAAVPEMGPLVSEGTEPKGEKEKPLRFEDILTDKGREKVPGVVEKFLASHHNGRDLACLYLVLDNNLYVKQVSRHQFYLALVASFGSLVAVKERNFQDFVKKIVDEELKDMDSVDKVKEDILKLINS